MKYVFWFHINFIFGIYFCHDQYSKDMCPQLENCSPLWLFRLLYPEWKEVCPKVEIQLNSLMTLFNNFQQFLDVITWLWINPHCRNICHIRLNCFCCCCWSDVIDSRHKRLPKLMLCSLYWYWYWTLIILNCREVWWHLWTGIYSTLCSHLLFSDVDSQNDIMKP